MRTAWNTQYNMGTSEEPLQQPELVELMYNTYLGRYILGQVHFFRLGGGGSSVQFQNSTPTYKIVKISVFNTKILN